MEPEPHTPPQAAPALVEFPTPQGPPLSSARWRCWAHNNATGQSYVEDDTDNSVQSRGKVLGSMPPKEFFKTFLPLAEPSTLTEAKLRLQMVHTSLYDGLGVRPVQ